MAYSKLYSKEQYALMYSLSEKFLNLQEKINMIEFFGLNAIKINYTDIVVEDICQLLCVIRNRHHFNYLSFAICDVFLLKVDIFPINKVTKSLRLHNNKLRAIPYLPNLKNIENVTITGNLLTDINDNLNVFSNLTHLYLFSNCIREIKNIEKLTKLVSLDLSCNKIVRISGLKTLTNLKTINLSTNRIMTVKNLETLTSLTDIDLSGNQLRAVGYLGSLVNLESLDLSWNLITRIASLENCVKLTRLDLSSNYLRNLGPIEPLPSLEHLDLSSNKLREIPVGINRLTRLRTLKLQSNFIKVIKNVNGLKDLTYLNLSNNKISVIKNLGGLTKLTHLLLRNNKIKTVENFEVLDNIKIVEIGTLFPLNYGFQYTANDADETRTI